MANATYERWTGAEMSARGAGERLGSAPRERPVRRCCSALRLWVSVCLALYVAFWLELDNAFWAGTSAAIVCQPQLGASLRKAWFRMVGTIVGAVMIVVLNACFPQDRIAFLSLLALWLAVCAFAATLMRNFASYAAALAGYTAAIIAADTLGRDRRPGRPGFHVGGHPRQRDLHRDRMRRHRARWDRLWRAQRQLAGLFATLAAEITSRFAGMLTLAGSTWIRALSDASSPGASSRLTGSRPGDRGIQPIALPLAGVCKGRWRACSRRSMAGAQLRRT